MDLQKHISKLRNWAAAYIQQFVSPDPRIQEAMDLKEAHTLRVCEAILDIARHEGLAGEDLLIAEAAALLHDIGRFEQFRKYGTFSDARSENHALLGVSVIRRNTVLEGLDPVQARMIVRAVEYHNKAALPFDENGRGLFFMKLLRDADKVDIWKVVTDYYRDASAKRNRTIELNLPNTMEISNAVFRTLMQGKIVQMADLKTLNDFKLLQIGWIYDVNFFRTFQMVQERGYLEQIRQALPADSSPIDKVYERARDYLQRRIFEG